MSAMFQPTYTKPVPATAEIVDRDGRPHVKLRENNRTVYYPLTAGGKTYLRRAKMWFAEVRQPDGTLKRVSLSRNKQAAEAMLADLRRTVELTKAGLVNPFAKYLDTPLVEHVVAWKAHMLASGAGAKHADESTSAAMKAFAWCGFVMPTDVTIERTQAYVAHLRTPPPAIPIPDRDSFTKTELASLLGVAPDSIPPMVLRHNLAATGNGKARRFPRATAEALVSRKCAPPSPRTVNLAIATLKAFFNYLVDAKRIPESPLGMLGRVAENGGRKRLRRPLTAEELQRLLTAAGSSTAAFRGLDGPSRAMLYRLAAATGFRVDELASLTPAAFSLDAARPVVILLADDAKNGQRVEQPLPGWLVPALRAYLAGRPPATAVWAGTWGERSSEMFGRDLAAAGIPYKVESVDGPRYADFHALRHTFINLLDKSGATLKEAMQLARHSDPKLTMAVYGRDDAGQLGEIVDRMPGPACQLVGKLVVGTGDRGGLSGTIEETCTVDADGVEGDASREMSGDLSENEGEGENSSRRIRTFDQPINRQTVGPRNVLRFPAITDPRHPACGKACEDSPDLTRIVQLWPHLPAHVQATIITLVDAHRPRKIA